MPGPVSCTAEWRHGSADQVGDLQRLESWPNSADTRVVNRSKHRGVWRCDTEAFGGLFGGLFEGPVGGPVGGTWKLELKDTGGL